MHSFEHFVTDTASPIYNYLQETETTYQLYVLGKRLLRCLITENFIAFYNLLLIHSAPIQLFTGNIDKIALMSVQI